jgi:hypothetical protein
MAVTPFYFSALPWNARSLTKALPLAYKSLTASRFRAKMLRLDSAPLLNATSDAL